MNDLIETGKRIAAAHDLYLAAVKAANDAHERGMSASTIARRWRAAFAAEDALRLADGGGWR